MRIIKNLLAALFILSGFTVANAQTLNLHVEHQRIVGTRLYFDIYMQSSNSTSIFLGNSDFVFTYNTGVLTPTAVGYVSNGTVTGSNTPNSGTVLKKSGGSATTAYNTLISVDSGKVSNASSGRIIINVQSPGSSSSELAEITNTGKHYLGTFYIDGLTSNAFPDLTWSTPSTHTTGIVTKAFRIVNNRSQRATIGANNPDPGATQPTTQPTLTVASFTSSSITLDLTAGNGSNSIIIAKRSAAVNANPVDGMLYGTSLTYGSGDEIGDSNFVVYRGGTSGTITITGLEAGYTYHFAAYEMNGSDGVTENYNTTNPSTVSQAIYEAEPTNDVTDLTVSAFTVSSISLSWTNPVTGGGDGRIIVVREGSALSNNPEDGETFTNGSAAFGSASELTGTAGHKVVYDGTGTSATITGLDMNKKYYVGVYEYNGAAGYENYKNSTSATTSAITKLTLDATVVLSGPYDGSAMTTDLKSRNRIPANQPYNSAPWSYAGTEQVSTSSGVVVLPDSNVVDWVLVELRKSTNTSGVNATTVISQQAGFLLSDGSIISASSTPGNLLPLAMTLGDASENLFLVIYHRNHIPIMSGSVVSRPVSGDYSFDFTTASNKAYGTSAMLEVTTGVFGMYPGNVDHSAGSALDIDASDRTKVWDDKNLMGYELSDVDLDGFVNAGDRALVDDNATSSTTSQIP